MNERLSEQAQVSHYWGLWQWGWQQKLGKTQAHREAFHLTELGTIKARFLHAQTH